MYSEKVRRMSRPLVVVLMLCLVFAMAPLLPMSDSDVNAADDTVLTIVNGTTTIKTFTDKELNALPQETSTYSALNNSDTFRTYANISGTTLETILQEAGIDLNKLAADASIKFEASDKPATRTWEFLTEPRYYFESTTSTTESGVEVPTILRNDKDDSPLKMYMGQLEPTERNNGYYANTVNKITISPTAKMNPVNVTLKGNGGKEPTSSIKAFPLEKYGNIAAATRSDYKFKGWFTAAKGGSEIKSSTIVNNLGDHTLYAQWTGANKYLKSLKTSKGKLSKKFKKTKTSYTIKLKKKQSKTKITATKAQSVAKVQIKVGKGKWKTAKSATVAVKKGKSKTVKIKVTSESKSTKTYTVKVKRAK